MCVSPPQSLTNRVPIFNPLWRSNLIAPDLSSSRPRVRSSRSILAGIPPCFCSCSFQARPRARSALPRPGGGADPKVLVQESRSSASESQLEIFSCIRGLRCRQRKVAARPRAPMRGEYFALGTQFKATRFAPVLGFVQPRKGATSRRVRLEYPARQLRPGISRTAWQSRTPLVRSERQPLTRESAC